jgi:PAS domain S-box-containing protein
MSNEDTIPAEDHIWLIDDEPDLVTVLVTILEDAGYGVRGFHDPREALAALETEAAPDLFLVDLNMPHLTGAELIRILRKRPALNTTPVIVITAMSTESSVINAFEAGADDVVQKPVGTPELLARINAQLARNERLSELRQENRDLKLVTELAQLLSQETQLPDILRTLIDGLRTALDVAQAAIYILEPTSGELHRALPAEPTRSEASPNTTLDLRDLPGAADQLAAREPAMFGPERTDRLLEAIGGAHPDLGEHRSSALFPMLYDDELVGAIVVFSRRPRLGHIARDRFIAAIISNFAAVAVHRAELFRKMRNDHLKLDRAISELSKTRDFLQNVIESSPDAIVASNRDGEIVLYNRAAERILGWTQAEALGADVRILYPDGGAERIMHMLRSAGFGGRGRLEPKREIVVGEDGDDVPVEISAAIVFDEDDEEAATVGIFTDLRGRIRMEERLQEATESLERSRRQAMIAELAGAAAHELNQPLTSLLGYAELLNRRIEEHDDNFRAAKTIHDEAQRIADIVRKIGRITEYRTKEYVGNARIVDLDGASEVEVDEPGLVESHTETMDEEP